MSVLIFTNSIEEKPVPSKLLSTSPELIVEASSTLGLKSKQSLNGKASPVTSEVYPPISLYKISE